MSAHCVDCGVFAETEKDQLSIGFVECYYCGDEVCFDCSILLGTHICCPTCSEEHWVKPLKSYKPTKAEIALIVADPIGWLENCRRRKGPNVKGFRYFVTFSRNPNSRYDRDAWLARVKKELSKAVVLKSSSVLEHEDTNLHCHALIETYKRVSAKFLFKVFARDYGYVDMRAVKTDQGIDAYMAKELPQGLVPTSDPTHLSFSIPYAEQDDTGCRPATG